MEAVFRARSSGGGGRQGGGMSGEIAAHVAAVMQLGWVIGERRAEFLTERDAVGTQCSQENRCNEMARLEIRRYGVGWGGSSQRSGRSGLVHSRVLNAGPFQVRIKMRRYKDRKTCCYLTFCIGPLTPCFLISAVWSCRYPMLLDFGCLVMSLHRG